ncbi:MAG: sigma-70 family RNA polymerase sigma factor [Anaerolineales bacterium]|nr:sigma-70 family RNA polymerase sigma factor [Anaerolineales bacterium]
MSSYDEADIIRSLVAEAKERGYLTYDQLVELYPDVEDDINLLETILEELQALDIPIPVYESEEEAEAIHQAERRNGGNSRKQYKGTASHIDKEPLSKYEEGLEFHSAPNFDLSNVPIDDSVGLYFREMGQQSLLSADQEVTLAKRIELGQDAIPELGKQNGNKNAKKELSENIELGKAARAHLIRANTRLVVSVAKKYRGRGLPFLDLIQEGNVGLIKAVEKYDYRRGNRFSTYATWWIRQAVTRALANHGRTIRIPAHLGGRISKLYQIAQEMEQVLGRQPTPEELAKYLDMTPDRVRWMLRTSRQPVHLERPVGDDSDAELGDFIEDEDAPPPHESVAQTMLAEDLTEVLNRLTPREARILRLRYGLQDGESRTLKEVGEMFGLSRERIRQLEKEALRKLRHPNLAGHLKQYIN